MTIPIRPFIRQLFSSLLLLNIARKYKTKSSLMKIKAAQVYVLGVKKTRLFFLGILFVFVALVLLVNGMSLLQTAVFAYSAWSNEAKFGVALALGGVEFLGAIGILIYLFREKTWGKFSEVHRVVNLATEERNKASHED